MTKENNPSQNQGKPSGKPRKSYYYRNRKRRDPQSLVGQINSKGNFSFRKVSIIVPLYNEEDSLKPLTAAIKKEFEKISCDYEILFIDDGSGDSSLKIIKESHRLDKRIKFYSFKKNYGKSAALQIGFKNASGDAIITMDADLQDDPAEIPNLLAKLDEGFDLVSGWKKVRHDPFIKKFSSRFFNYITRLISGIKIHDFNCGLKAYRSEVVKKVSVYGELHRYVPVLAHWEGFSVTEIPVKHHPRKYGKTKFGISRFFKGFIDLITVIFTTRYIKRPMHLFGFLGAVSSLLGIAVNAYLTYEWYVGIPLKDRPLLFLGILLIIVGVQFFAVGLLGELFTHHFQGSDEYNIKEKS
ncbi:MAG: glycosyltransferase family 2 protein [Bacteroidota bacterium]